MKNLLFMVLPAFASFALFGAAQVDRVLVRQQWPWSSDVRVEYTISGATSPAAVWFEFYDGETLIPVADLSSFAGDTAWAGNGTHVVTFDPKKTFRNVADEFADFKVRVCLGNESDQMGEKLYKVLDLNTGAVRDITRADFYNNKGLGDFETDYTAAANVKDATTQLSDVFIWTGITNNPVYQTDKMVFRRISGKVARVIGDSNETKATPHTVVFTKDYYVGVFPVTEAQLARILGTEGGGTLPASGKTYLELRGNSEEYDNWPSSGHAVDANSIIGTIRAKVPTFVIDLPTEAQWEYACRAGSTAALYTGKAAGKSSLVEIGWNSDNSASVRHAVGLKPVNPWGLYDMVGNVSEWCLDWSGDADDYADYAYASVDIPEEDPYGPAKSDSGATALGKGRHMIRGGSYSSGRTQMTSSFRAQTRGNQELDTIGFRLCFEEND